MPLTKWFRGHRRNNAVEGGGVQLVAETAKNKQGPKPIKVVTQRAHRSRSHGSGFRAMRAIVGLGGSPGSTPLEIEDSPEPEQRQRHIMRRARPLRRFTLQSDDDFPFDANWGTTSAPAGSLLLAPTSPPHTNTGHYGFGGNQQMIPAAPDSHPSIIFIDCPP